MREVHLDHPLLKQGSNTTGPAWPPVHRVYRSAPFGQGAMLKAFSFSSVTNLLKTPITSKRWLNIHEYQSKALMDKFGVNTQRWVLATTPQEAESGAKKLNAKEELRILHSPRNNLHLHPKHIRLLQPHYGESNITPFRMINIKFATSLSYKRFLDKRCPRKR